MVRSVEWKWDDIRSKVWEQPCEQAYFLAARWQQAGLRRFLDLGCGIGRHALFFASQGFQVDAYDLSSEGVARLEQLASQRGLMVHTQVGDMLKLPLPDASLDCILAYHVIYHTDKVGIEQVFSEIRRVLAPGGEIYLTLNSRRNPTFRDPSNQVINAYTIRKTHGLEAGVPHYYVDLRETRRLLKGFEMINLNHIGHLHDERFSWHYHILARKPA